MFAVGEILVSSDVFQASFACNPGSCLGACCVVGDSGAPLEPSERADLERVLPRVRKYLSPEALAVVNASGPWEEVAPGRYATSCVDGAECVFVTYEGPVARCAIQKAFQEGRVDFPKPVSCHLYPIRAERFGEAEVLNYDQIGICEPGRRMGSRNGSSLIDYLREPLVRKYGESWYGLLREIADARRELLIEASG
jgi:hypothetical protein